MGAPEGWWMEFDVALLEVVAERAKTGGEMVWRQGREERVIGGMIPYRTPTGRRGVLFAVE